MDDVEDHAASTTEPLDEVSDRIEVRLLGPLLVRRRDGSLVHPREWRTGKTSDLLRILALRAGRAVTVGYLLEALWPTVDEAKGRVSLRNALAQLRRVLGADAVERRQDGLVLRDAWVDTAVLERLAAEARRHARAGDLATAVRVAREADALHLAPISASSPDAMWLDAEREAIEATFREMLLDAADHAVRLGWMRDGLELARRALETDPAAERAFRALMRAHAGLGETERALREYERCRAVLAEELGVDPSPQTRALHVELLSVEPTEPAPVPLVGRSRELDELVTWFRDGLVARAPRVVYVGGAVESGRERLVMEAAAGLGLEITVAEDDGTGLVQRVTAALPGQGGGAGLEDAGAAAEGTVVLVRDGGSLPPAQRQALLAALADVRGAVTVALLVAASAAALLDRDAAGADGTTTPAVAVQLLPLPREEVERLATTVLAGPVVPQLVHELVAESESIPGRVVRILHEWSRTGRVAATGDGLTLVPAHDAADTGAQVSTLLARATERLDAAQLDVLYLVALLDRPVGAGLLVPLLPGSTPASVLGALDRLVDERLLTRRESGYVVGDALLRQGIVSWLRPSTRRRLHELVAGAAHIPTEERVLHWRAAGEPGLASAAALDAAREAREAGDAESARSHLLVVAELARSHGAEAGDLVDVLEQLAEACADVGRSAEAVEHFEAARALIAVSDPARAQRLARSAEQLQAAYLRELDRAATPARPQAAGPVVVVDADDEEELRAAVAAADARGDLGEAVLARLRLAENVLLPQRHLAAAKEVTAEAVRLAGDGPLQAQAVAGHLLPDVLLGDARSAEGTIDAAWAATPPGTPGAERLALLRALVGHDLGHGDVRARWRQVGEGHPAPESLAWARVRMLTERGSLAEALEADRAPRPVEAPPLQRQLRALASAALLSALGRGAEAVSVLLEAVRDADEEGCILLLPEVTARLVMLTSATEPDVALRHFELFDWVTGAHVGHPREGFLRLMARAAIRAGQEELDRAAAAAANAARIAEDSGLLLLAAEAYLAQAQHLFAEGRAPGARLATASAARCLRAAGTAG